jgi:hypothetical protein
MRLGGFSYKPRPGGACRVAPLFTTGGVMETNRNGGALRLPIQELAQIDPAELTLPPVPPAPPAPAAAAPKPTKKPWEIGDTVRIGSLYLRVAEFLPPARKGEAGRTRLVTHDLSRQYIWTPFRGLKVVGGAPKKRRRKPVAAGPRRPAPVPQRAKPAKLGLLARFWRAMRPH